MGEFVSLESADGAKLSAWRADPAGKPRGGIVVVQEIFGVNHHIRAMADFFAGQGYFAIAPALFDRVEKGFDRPYDAESRTRGMAIVGKLNREQMLLDVAAAVQVAKSAGKVAVVGYCLGGSLAYFAVCRQPDVSAAVGYYGGMVLSAKDERPMAPTMLHFGERDAHIPIAGVREFAAAHPDISVFTYPAEHGFNCDERASYDAPSAALARERTLPFLAKNIG
jgi:carboxymethylenebutenolidase